MLFGVIPTAAEEAAKTEKVRGNPIRPAVLDTSFLPRKDKAEVFAGGVPINLSTRDRLLLDADAPYIRASSIV